MFFNLSFSHCAKIDISFVAEKIARSVQAPLFTTQIFDAFYLRLSIFPDISKGSSYPAYSIQLHLFLQFNYPSQPTPVLKPISFNYEFIQEYFLEVIVDCHYQQIEGLPIFVAFSLSYSICHIEAHPDVLQHMQETGWYYKPGTKMVLTV